MTGSTFLQRLQSGEILVSDGATGTNLQARGLTRGTPSEVWVLENPQEILRLHSDFVAAGSDIILTSTFGGSTLRLQHAGLRERAEEVNRRAVALARQAAGEKALVAGSLGPLGQMMQPLGPLSEEEAGAAYAAQAKVLSEAGVDLLLVETQFDLAEATAAVNAARSVSSLPLVCSFSYDRGTRTMMGVKPAQMAKHIGALGVDALGINCGRSLEENLQALKELRQATDLPIWFKPNAGLPVMDAAGNPTYTLTPEIMGQQVEQWVAAGARVVGGCCGNSPEHVHQIALAAKRLSKAA